MTAPTMIVDGEERTEVRTPKTVFRMKLPHPVPPMSFVRHKVELSGR